MLTRTMPPIRTAPARATTLAVITLLCTLATQSGCILEQRDMQSTKHLFFADDTQRMAEVGMKPINIESPDAPSVTSLSRTGWTSSTGRGGSAPATTVHYVSGRVDHFQTYNRRPGYLKFSTRQRNDWPTVDSALDLPDDEDRLLMIGEAAAWPFWSAIDTLMLVPKSLTTPAWKPQSSGIIGSMRPSPVVSLYAPANPGAGTIKHGPIDENPVSPTNPAAAPARPKTPAAPQSPPAAAAPATINDNPISATNPAAPPPSSPKKPAPKQPPSTPPTTPPKP